VIIVGSFSYFVFLKPYLFTSRVDAWQSLFSPPMEWSPILKGVLVFAACTVALLIAAWYVFRRKDILV
jgi:ABC-type transport system involved in multi-copper enzyme maturation permease subunit